MNRNCLFWIHVLGFALVSGSASADKVTKPPNFVVIMTDDQSWVGSSLLMDPDNPQTRSHYYRTPNIKRLAKRGMRFVQGYAPAPFCCPTRRSFLIGQTPARHVYQADQPGWVKSYRKQLSLPQMLKAANKNYRTAHFGKWDSRFDGVSPEEMGYDVSDGTTGNDTGGGKGDENRGASDDPKLAFSVTKRAGDFIETQSANGHPFFVQISHYAVHLDIFYRQQTLTAAKEWDRDARHTLPEFAAMTSDVDDAIGQLLDRITALGLDQQTYLFFFSDNGGRLTMPGQEGATLPRNHPLRDGKGSMYEGGIRVPFIVCGPDVRGNTISRVPVTALDLFPTMAELAGYTEPLPESLDGGSLTDILRDGGVGSVKRANPFLLFHQAVARKAQTALVQNNFKLVKTWEEGKVELFDLSTDLGEQHDLSNQMPRKRKELHQWMTRYLHDVGAETRRTTTKQEHKKLFETAANDADTRAVTPDTSVTPIASNGGLKMLYDNRSYPQAVAIDNSLHIAWRGHQGFPFLATYNLQTGDISQSQILMQDLIDEIDKKKYQRDHHYAPVIWTDQRQHIHVLFGCHRTPGIHLISANPNSTSAWKRGPPPAESISYPQVHRCHDDQTLIYYRQSGHLGSWQYRISSDGGHRWDRPAQTSIDMNATPHDSEHASHAGSYNTTAVSKDGTRLHIAFIWKVEDPVFNKRYSQMLGDHTQRYNLYYAYIDLLTGTAYNIDGRKLELPIRKRVAEDHCLVWDSDERVVAVGPSIALDENDRPHFLLPISNDTPLASTFHHVRRAQNVWEKTPITTTLHPFNASHLQHHGDGRLNAYLVVGSNAKVDESGMDEYGWGQRIEHWTSSDDGKSWRLSHDLTSSLPNKKFQNVKYISRETKHAIDDMILFYGWSDQDSHGTAYLWHK